jgi:phosphopantothenate synthetase
MRLAAAPAVEGVAAAAAPREVERVSEKLGLELEVELVYIP